MTNKPAKLPKPLPKEIAVYAKLKGIEVPGWEDWSDAQGVACPAKNCKAPKGKPCKLPQYVGDRKIFSQFDVHSVRWRVWAGEEET